MMPAFEYVRARSLDEAVQHLSSGGAVVHAGGTDLLGCLRERVFPVGRMVSISALKELAGIRETSSGIRIGALTTVAEIAESPLIKKLYPGLAQAAGEVASPQLRNQGTIGGNICQKPRCWYYRGEFHCLRKGGDTCFAVSGENQFHCVLGGENCFIVHPSDTAPALLALDAQVQIVGPKGARSVAIADFFVSPARDPKKETVLAAAEIVTEILLPRPPMGLRSSYRKIRARRSWDFALAGVALALQLDGNRVIGGRVVLSGAAPVPWRSLEVEEVISGRPLDAKTVSSAKDAVMKKAQPLAQNAYKIGLFQAVIEEELLAVART